MPSVRTHVDLQSLAILTPCLEHNIHSIKRNRFISRLKARAEDLELLGWRAEVLVEGKRFKQILIYLILAKDWKGVLVA